MTILKQNGERTEQINLFFSCIDCLLYLKTLKAIYKKELGDLLKV